MASASGGLSATVGAALLRRVRGGELTVGGERFGTQDATDPLHARVTLGDPGAWWNGLLRGSYGLARAYADGAWECDDLVALVRIGARNMGAFDAARERLVPVLAPARRLAGRMRPNTPARSRRQIAAHYDLGNALFGQFLDESMMYSCALYEDPDATLEEAQRAKLEHICARLGLGPSDHVLEIGTGWGGFAVHAAATRGCRVTTTTISAEQHALATERVRAAGLERLVTVLREDYRDLRGTFDKLVSIEMVEAVGWQRLPEYFRRCAALLRRNGAALIQAITIDDRAYEAEKAGRSFIKDIVFPGGCLPSVEVIARCCARHTDLRIVGLEDITASYPPTLAAWRERFRAAEPRLGEQGYDRRFRRLWELYLSYCEAGFLERRIQDVQVLLAKPRHRSEPLSHGALAFVRAQG